MSGLGRFYGVGVGPGDPGLLTYRAVEVMRAVPVLALPCARPTTPSLAWRIAGGVVGPVEGQERLELLFPMSRDPKVTTASRDEAFAQVAQRLEAGQDVAFLTEGDPLVYSTFIHLLGRAKSRWPQLEVEVVPGVTSLTAVAAVAQAPLVDGAERLAVVPALYGHDDLAWLLERFDTLLLTKVGSRMEEVRATLEEMGLLEQALFVSRATMEGQRVVRDLRQLEAAGCDYFSMVLVRGKGFKPQAQEEAEGLADPAKPAAPTPKPATDGALL